MSDPSYTHWDAVNGINNTLWQTLIDPTVGLELEVPGFSADHSLAPVLWNEYGDDADLVLNKANLFAAVQFLERAKQVFLNTKTRRVYSREGFMLVEIFVPLSEGLQKALNIGTVCKRAFEGKRGFGSASGIEFKDVSLRNGGALRGFTLCHVKANFEYQEAIAEE